MSASTEVVRKRSLSLDPLVMHARGVRAARLRVGRSRPQTRPLVPSAREAARQGDVVDHRQVGHQIDQVMDGGVAGAHLELFGGDAAVHDRLGRIRCDRRETGPAGGPAIVGKSEVGTGQAPRSAPPSQYEKFVGPSRGYDTPPTARMAEPAMQTPFTAGVDELIAHLRLQHLELGQSVTPREPNSLVEFDPSGRVGPRDDTPSRGPLDAGNGFLEAPSDWRSRGRHSGAPLSPGKLAAHKINRRSISTVNKNKARDCVRLVGSVLTLLTHQSGNSTVELIQ